MILNLGKKAAPAVPQAPDTDIIFSVDAHSFEDKVMRASIKTPVLVEFWAPWCGPCKQLMPVMEAVVNAAKGAVLMAKVNIDENPELAQALRVQSVPMVFAFFGGQPVSAFTGARPQGEIKTLVDQLIAMARQAQPQALDIPALLKDAATALSENNPQLALSLYAAIMEQDEINAAAYAGLIRTYIAAGHVEQARDMLTHAPEALVKNAQLEAARVAVELAEAAPTGNEGKLRAQLDKNPGDHQTRFDLAEILFAAGKKEEAIDALLDIIRRERVWSEDKARQQLIKYFDALGGSDPLVMAGRRKLSTILFS